MTSRENTLLPRNIIRVCNVYSQVHICMLSFLISLTTCMKLNYLIVTCLHDICFRYICRISSDRINYCFLVKRLFYDSRIVNEKLNTNVNAINNIPIYPNLKSVYDLPKIVTVLPLTHNSLRAQMLQPPFCLSSKVRIFRLHPSHRLFSRLRNHSTVSLTIPLGK